MRMQKAKVVEKYVKILTIYALTIIGKLISYPKIIRTNDKTSHKISCTFKKEWLYRHNRPTIRTHNNSSKFASKF